MNTGIVLIQKIITMFPIKQFLQNSVQIVVQKISIQKHSVTISGKSRKTQKANHKPLLLHSSILKDARCTKKNLK